MKKSIVRVLDVPVSQLPSDWAITLKQSQSSLGLPVYDPILNQYLAIQDAKWSILLHLVIKKKWLSRLKIPCDKKIADFYEPVGEWLYRTLELCIQCHALAPSTYVNAAAWFSAITSEAKTSVALRFINQDSEGSIQEIKDECYKISNTLRKGSNPYDPEQDRHTHALIEASLTLSERSDRFRKDYWKPFLSSHARSNSQLKAGGGGVLSREGEKIWFSSGRGRGKIRYI